MVQLVQAVSDLQAAEADASSLRTLLDRDRKARDRKRRGSGGFWGLGKAQADEEQTVVLELSRKLEELLIDNEDLRNKLAKIKAGGPISPGTLAGPLSGKIRGEF